MVKFGTTEGGKQDALGNVQRDIESVRGIMTENIERVLERGERIDLLVDKTDRLGVGAHDFRVRSRGLKRQMWWKNVKLMVLLGVVVVFLVYLFVGFGCGLPGELRAFFFAFGGRVMGRRVRPFRGSGDCYAGCSLLLRWLLVFNDVVPKLTFLAAWSRCTGN